jgi:hypothetical protein
VKVFNSDVLDEERMDVGAHSTCNCERFYAKTWQPSGECNTRYFEGATSTTPQALCCELFRVGVGLTATDQRTLKRLPKLGFAFQSNPLSFYCLQSKPSVRLTKLTCFVAHDGGVNSHLLGMGVISP